MVAPMQEQEEPLPKSTPEEGETWGPEDPVNEDPIQQEKEQE